MKEVVKRQMSVMYYINAYHELELKFQDNKISAYQFGIELSEIVNKFQLFCKEQKGSKPGDVLDTAEIFLAWLKGEDITQKMLDDYYNLRH